MKELDSLTIEKLRENIVIPFEYKEEKLIKIFSFFLHQAPSIDSESAMTLSPDKLNNIWNLFIKSWTENNFNYMIYSADSKFPNESVLRNRYNLSESSVISRRTCAFICFKKSKEPKESELETLLRHIRNAIAHGHVYIKKQSNRYFILLESYGSSKNRRAIMLFSQAQLENLRKNIEKHKQN